MWERDDNIWYGVDGNQVISVDASRKVPRIRSHTGRVRDIFRRNDNISRIISDISRDKHVADAVRRARGMRLMRQDPFQCLITFITSTNSNIPRIKNTLRTICTKYGETAEMNGRTFSLFPTPERLARARGLTSCGLGYRVKYVKQAAGMVSSGRLDLAALRTEPYDMAMEALLAVPGVGNKVADCVLLFSLEKLDAFPLDRWMLKILHETYPRFGNIKSLTPLQYARMHDIVVGHFGRYAGYAQQFLFRVARDDARRRWAVNP